MLDIIQFICGWEINCCFINASVLLWNYLEGFVIVSQNVLLIKTINSHSMVNFFIYIVDLPHWLLSSNNLQILYTYDFNELRSVHPNLRDLNDRVETGFKKLRISYHSNLNKSRRRQKFKDGFFLKINKRLLVVWVRQVTTAIYGTNLNCAIGTVCGTWNSCGSVLNGYGTNHSLLIVFKMV